MPRHLMMSHEHVIRSRDSTHICLVLDPSGSLALLIKGDGADFILLPSQKGV
jgi:hypothetical protein